jgi:hypothetical protein
MPDVPSGSNRNRRRRRIIIIFIHLPVCVNSTNEDYITPLINTYMCLCHITDVAHFVFSSHINSIEYGVPSTSKQSLKIKVHT